MKVLELFCGTKSVGKGCNRKGWTDVVSLDIERKYEPTICTDILEWDYTTLDFVPDLIWGSPVCTFFSSLQQLNMNRSVEEKQEKVNDGLELVEKTFEIINYFKGINPDLKWIIENPKNSLRNSELMNGVKRVETTYCKYGYKYKKPTIFYHSDNVELKLRSPCKKRDPCTNILSHTEYTHMERIGIVSKIWKPHDEQKTVSDKNKLYSIPPDLIDEILNSF